jgi:serine protease
MTRPFPGLGRRALMLGGAAMATATTGCGIAFPPSEKREGACQYDDESPIAGSQSNCQPTMGTPTDLAWHLRSLRVTEAWHVTEKARRYGRGIVIGHIDTGVAEHEEFKTDNKTDPYKGGGILWERGYDFIDEVRGGYDPLIDHFEYIEQIGHGTATASVIVSRGETIDWKRYAPTCGGTIPPGRITGVAPAADLIPVRAFRMAATWNFERIAEAIDYLRDQKVHVITMALGWPFTGWPFKPALLERAIRDAIADGILVLAAAGNFISSVTFPASGGAAIAVGAVGPDDKPWCGGSQGREVHVSAPGDKVWRAYRDDKSHRRDIVGPRFGTSFSVSLTAGVAALWLGHFERDNLIRQVGKGNLHKAFRDALQRTARKPKGWDNNHDRLGTGIVDAFKLLTENEFQPPVPG